MSRDQDERILTWAGGEPAHKCSSSPVSNQSFCEESPGSVNTTTYTDNMSVVAHVNHMGGDKIPRPSLPH